MKQKLIKKAFHRIRLFISLFLGIEPSRISKLAASTIYEFRLMVGVTFMVMFFYFITEFLMDGTESELVKLLIKFNCLVILVIFYLIIKILSKLKKRPLCEYKSSSYNWDYITKLRNKDKDER